MHSHRKITAAPWIETNPGYLRYLCSTTKDAPWLTNEPPAGKLLTGRRYEQALAGAHWVLSPAPAMTKLEWTSLIRHLHFIQSLPDVRHLETYSTLGVSIAAQTGATVSGGVLDMIGAQHIPFQIVKAAKGMAQFFDFAGNAIVKFTATSRGRFALRKQDVDDLEHVYRRVQVITGRTNYGLRVFNGAGILSAPYQLPDGKVLVLLATYTDYPAEDITLHVRGPWKKSVLRTASGPDTPLVSYPVMGAVFVE